MSVREYIGARYVPILMGEWDNTRTYEPLSIVMYQGNSYTSRQFVPVGTAITNNDFWAATGNYNAQVEAYRQEVQNFDGRIDALEGHFDENGKLIAGSVVTDSIANFAVTNQKIADDAIDAFKLAPASVDTRNYSDSSITTAKIANLQVTTEKIANGAITPEKLEEDSYFYIVPNDYAMLKLKKSKYHIGIDNNSGTSSGQPISNVLDYMKAHPDTFDIGHNCDFASGYDTNTFPMRLNGIDFNASTAFPHSGAFAFDTETQTIQIYPNGTLLANIPASFDCAFTISYPLIIGGVAQDPREDPLGYVAPRLAFGWDANYYYVIFTNGRVLGCEGKTLPEMVQIGVQHGIANLYTFDGGGSICVAANTPAPVALSNTRDKVYKYPQRRKTTLIFGYKHI